MTVTVPPILRSQPGDATLLPKPWAGRRLGRLRGRAGEHIGESWEFSTVPGHVSRALDRPLDEVLATRLPFLAKLIDTAKPLSVQVHPDDTADALGKEEAWVILAAEPDARLLCGIRPGVAADDFDDVVRRAAHDPTAGDDLLGLLDAIAVSPGTCVLLPAGTVHAIGGGILLAEIQQPTDCTFRMFDYGSGRELHIDDALAATKHDARPLVWRPGDAPRALAGKHVRLGLVAPDRDEHVVDSPPAWIVAVSDGVRIEHAGGTEQLSACDTVLCTTRAHVSGDLAVVGTCV